MASIDLYTKQQIDAKIPDTTGASSGDVLTFNGSANVWAAPSGGAGVTAHTYASFGALVTDILAHPNGILKHDHSVSGLGLMDFNLGTNAVTFLINYTTRDGSTGVMIGAGDSSSISNSSTATSINIDRTTAYATGSGNTISTYTIAVSIATLTFYY